MINRLLPVIICGLILMGCANRPAQYRVDPEIQLSQNSVISGKTLTLEIIAPNNEPRETEQSIELAPVNDFDQAIKANLIKALGSQGFRFSANRHFSDLVMTLDFSELRARIDKQLMRDTLQVDGQLTLLLESKQKRLSKSFQRKQTLTVAISSDYAEVTGLVNQVVSELLRAALTDPDVESFINQTP
jgi:uncharacterized lipoprotein YajG